MALSLKFKRNPTFSDLPKIEVGDRVILHVENAFEPNVRADVLAYDDKGISVRIVDIFDRDGAGEITGGEILKHKGKTIPVEPANVFKVLKP
jgi:hypothetical protein